MEFKDFIEKKRKERQITIRKFADLLDISPSFYCDLIRGDRAFPANSKKNPHLRQSIIDVLKLSKKEIKDLDDSIQESLTRMKRMPKDMSLYLSKTPIAQQALRKAKELNISNEEWEKILKSFNK